MSLQPSLNLTSGAPHWLGILSVTLAALIASVVLTGLVRRYALERQLLDIPNDRSSHTQPTPRGGGLGFVCIILGSLPILAGAGAIKVDLAWGLGGAGALVAAIGWLDDHRHVAARWRLLVHGLAAAWGLTWLGGLPPLAWGETLVDLGWPGHLLAWLGLIWLLNLYNFMDGIDGLAASEACCVLAGALLLLALAAVPPLPLGTLLAVALGAIAGFLWWNRPPAKIFMGDAGSGFIGLLLGLMAVAIGRENPEQLWSWVIMLAVFIVDASWTLARRAARRVPVFQAHRQHGYQRAARRWSHGAVTVAVAIITGAWLIPIATAVATDARHALEGLALAYLPVWGIALYLKAGTASDH